MSINPHHTLDAPTGMATAVVRKTLSENRAQFIQGLTPARYGRMVPAPILKDLLTGWPSTASILGTAVWLSSDGQNDRLLVVNDTALYSIKLFYTSGTTPAYNYDEVLEGQRSYIKLGDRTTVQANSSTWTAGSTISFAVQFATELIFAIGSTLWRYYVDEGTGAENIYSLGLIPGGAPTLAATTGGSLTPSATYEYLWTFVDELGRESSPSDAASVSLSSSQNAVTVTRGSGTTGGTTGITDWNIYRLNPGSTTFNFVTTVAVGTTSFTDTFDDNTVAAGDVAPDAGENDPPSGALAASFGGAATIGQVWKDRLVLNSTNTPNMIQISNAGSPTQFSSLQLPTNVDDGLRISLYSQGDNEVTGLGDLGSLLAIFTRQSIQLLFGDDITSFQIRPAHVRGCANPRSIQRCENIIMFLSDDGVYSLGYENGYAIKKMSIDIDNYFHGFIATGSTDPTSTGRLKAVQVAVTPLTSVNSFYFENRYYLSFGDVTLVYDMISGGWADTGWGFLKTASVYQSQSADTTYHGAPDSVFVTLAGQDTSATSFNYFTDADTPTDPDSPSTISTTLLTRTYDGDTPTQPQNRLKRAKRFSLYGKANVPDGTVIGQITGYADGNPVETYPIYANFWIDSPDALYQQEWIAMKGYELYVKMEFTEPSIEVNSTKMEYSFLS